MTRSTAGRVYQCERPRRAARRRAAFGGIEQRGHLEQDATEHEVWLPSLFPSFSPVEMQIRPLNTKKIGFSSLVENEVHEDFCGFAAVRSSDSRGFFSCVLCVSWVHF